MKYENFDKAKSLVSEINKTKEILKELSSECIVVKISGSGYNIVSMDVGPNYNAPLCQLATDLVKEVRLYYEGNLETLTKELETL